MKTVSAGARREECRGEGLDAAGGAVGPAGVDCGREATLLVAEEQWIARVEALTRFLEEVEAVAHLGHLSQRDRLDRIKNLLANARLRDLTEESE